MLAFALLALTACKGKEDDFPFIAFNGDSDVLTICVGDGSCEPVSAIDLHSTNDSTVVGAASVDPASGPVGTIHRIAVEIDEEWNETVQLVQVVMDGDRGEQTWDLSQDSADHGNWVVDVESLGDPGESRADTATILLWQPAESTTTPTSTTATQ
jgi:hypothetical protein